jgi:hypothetical protein
VLKVPSRREETGVVEASHAKAREVLDVHAVEFSKTGPRRGLPTKKASDSRGRPSKEVIRVVSGFGRRALRCSRVVSSVRSRLGGRRMIATLGGVSRSRAEADELALPHLEEGALESASGHVQVADNAVVELDAPLGDQPARLARREPEELADECR